MKFLSLKQIRNILSDNGVLLSKNALYRLTEQVSFARKVGGRWYFEEYPCREYIKMYIEKVKLMHSSECMSLTNAMQLCKSLQIKTSKPTVRKWCRQYGLSNSDGSGRHWILKQLFFKHLEQYSPAVRRILQPNFPEQVTTTEAKELAANRGIYLDLATIRRLARKKKILHPWRNKQMTLDREQFLAALGERG